MKNDRLSLIPSHSPSGTRSPLVFSPDHMRPMSDGLVQIMWRRRWIVVGCVIVVLTASLLYLARMTPLYSSTARVYVEQTGPRIIHEMPEGVMTGSMNYLYTQAELMKATPVVSEAVERCGAKGLRVLAHVDSPAEFVTSNLMVSLGRKDDIIRVSFRSPYPAENAQIVNAVVDAYVAFHAKRKRSTSAEVLKILQKEKATRDKALSDHSRELIQFREDHPTLAFQTDFGNTILERFERLSTALTEAQLATLEAKSYYDAAEQMRDDSAALLPFVEAYADKMQGAVSAPETAALKARLRELLRNRSDRLKLVTREHPGVQALEAEIDQIRREIATLDQQSVASHLAILKQRYLSAKEKEGHLVARFEDQRQQVTSLNKVMAQYTILESEYEQTKKLCDILNDRIREVNITEDAGALNITILETARPAFAPSDPRKARVLAVALVLGLMLGGGTAFLREMIDHRLRTADEATTLLGSSLLGEVPMMSERETPMERAQKMALEPSSAVAEAFRNIRTAVFFRVPREQARIIQVTSAMSGEGKSTVVSNLGIAMAQSGHTVLIVDADFRQPIQHLNFGVSGDKGLSTVLVRRQRLGEAIVRTSTSGLHLLPAGLEVPHPVERLGGPLFGAVLARLAQHYDRVLVDTPPLGPMADARIVAAQCQATILVVRPGVCTDWALRHARQSLLHVGNHIIGAVVNGIYRGRSWDSLARWVSYFQGNHTGGNGKERGRQQVAGLSLEQREASLSKQAEEHTRIRTVTDAMHV